MSSDQARHVVRVLELFSGIGGMHYALQEVAATRGSDLSYRVVAALDISDVANKVYRYNFPDTLLRGTNICGLTTSQLDSWGVDAIFMSPPCQPFTRQGLKGDLGDPRTQPLVHIINLIPSLDCLEFILLENVKGFETSQACQLLLEALSKTGFYLRQFLISPTDLNIPNSRLRYYLVARKNRDFAFGRPDSICTDVSFALAPEGTHEDLIEKSPSAEKGRSKSCTLREFLDSGDPDQRFFLDNDVLRKHINILDIVDRNSASSCCFTKSYGRYAEGTGSVIREGHEEVADVFKRLEAIDSKNLEEFSKVAGLLRLRYFSPLEIARLMGFPVAGTAGEAFGFPPDYAEKPLLCYRVLGNSLNVKVVAFLIRLLFDCPPLDMK